MNALPRSRWSNTLVPSRCASLVKTFRSSLCQMRQYPICTTGRQPEEEPPYKSKSLLGHGSGGLANLAHVPGAKRILVRLKGIECTCKSRARADDLGVGLDSRQRIGRAGQEEGLEGCQVRVRVREDFFEINDRANGVSVSIRRWWAKQRSLPDWSKLLVDAKQPLVIQLRLWHVKINCEMKCGQPLPPWPNLIYTQTTNGNKSDVKPLVSFTWRALDPSTCPSSSSQSLSSMRPRRK